jgi:hypothetical protein
VSIHTAGVAHPHRPSLSADACLSLSPVRFLKLARLCREEDIYEGVLGAAAYMGASNDDFIHGITLLMYSRVQQTLHSCERCGS